MRTIVRRRTNETLRRAAGGRLRTKRSKQLDVRELLPYLHRPPDGSRDDPSAVELWQEDVAEVEASLAKGERRMRFARVNSDRTDQASRVRSHDSDACEGEGGELKG